MFFYIYNGIKSNTDTTHSMISIHVSVTFINSRMSGNVETDAVLLVESCFDFLNAFICKLIG